MTIYGNRPLNSCYHSGLANTLSYIPRKQPPVSWRIAGPYNGRTRPVQQLNRLKRDCLHLEVAARYAKEKIT